jgi:hypothetical protein
MSFIPENNPEVFGDYTCKGSTMEYSKDDKYISLDGCRVTGNAHSPTRHWGFRHWIWFIAGLTFAVWTIIEVIDQKK